MNNEVPQFTPIAGPLFEQDTRFINAQMQPALLMDLLMSQNISSHHFLKGTGLFYEDIQTAPRLISPDQFLKLISNARKLYPSPELEFRYGQLLWPGYYGPFSQLLAGADCLQTALEILIRYRRHLCPLLVPEIHFTDSHCCLFWNESAGTGEQLTFLAEAYSTAITVLSEIGLGQALPWHALFSRNTPDNLHDYQAYLGTQVHFKLGVNALLIEKHWLQKPWQTPRGHSTPTAINMTRSACDAQAATMQSGFLECVHHYLSQHSECAPSLEDTANHFAISTATLKRKLNKHAISFQKLQDRVRMQACFKLMCQNKHSNEALADILQFNNSTNFRRAFKRWCGLTPGDSKAVLARVLG